MMNDEDSHILAGLSSSDRTFDYSHKNLQRKNSKSRSSHHVRIEDPVSVSNYAEAKYVKRSSSRSTASTRSSNSDEESLQQKEDILDVPSHHSHPEDPLNNSCSFHMENDELLQDEFFDEIEMRDKADNFDQFGSREVHKRRHRRNYAVLAKRYARQASLVCLGLIVVIAAVAGAFGGKASSSSSNNYDTNAALVQQVPPAPSTLKMVCNMSTEGILSASCTNACNKSECCWNPNGSLACSLETQDNCPTYVEPCSVMMEQEMKTEEQAVATQAPQMTEMVVSKAPFTLQEECSMQGLGVTQICQEQCAASECCWSRNSPYSCTSDTVQNCGIYKSVCSFYNEDTYEQILEEPAPVPITLQGELPFPPAPIGIVYFCDPERMGETNLAVCKDKCSEAECCWKTGAESCVNSVPNNACADYTHACTFWNDRDENGNVTSVPAAKTAAPAESNSNADTTTTVESNTTVNTENTESSHTNSPMAGHSDTDLVSGTSPVAGASPEIPTAPADLQTRCAFVSMTTPEGKKDCQDQCALAECCWVNTDNADGIASCNAENKDACDGYTSCGVLIDIMGDDHAAVRGTPPAATAGTGVNIDTTETVATLADVSTAIVAACNVGSPSFQRSHCVDVCKAGSCCFDSTETCHADTDCAYYDPCSALNRRNLRLGA